MTAPRLAICMAPGGLPGIEQHVGAWLACARRGITPAWLGGAWDDVVYHCGTLKDADEVFPYLVQGVTQ